jgi:hypothetical protein
MIKNDVDPLPVPELYDTVKSDKEFIENEIAKTGILIKKLKQSLKDMELFCEQAVLLYQVCTRLEKRFDADTEENCLVLFWKERAKRIIVRTKE